MTGSLSNVVGDRGRPDIECSDGRQVQSKTSTSSSRFDRPQRFGEVVAEEVVRSLARGDYAPGERLPTEPQMQESFGVSRTVLREALKFVESRGMVTIRQGRGAVVLPTAQWNLLDPVVLSATLENHSSPEFFEQLMAVRALLEPELTRSAAVLIGRDDLRQLAQLLERMATELGDPEDYLQHDVEFHAVINRNADNLLACSVMTSIEQPLRSSRRLTNTVPHALDQAQHDHETIYGYLLAHDGEAAAAAMRAHLARSRDALLLRWSALPVTDRDGSRSSGQRS